MNRSALVLGLLALLTACGGGGAAWVDAGGAGSAPVDENTQLVQGLLEGCGESDVVDVLDLQEMLLDLLSGGEDAVRFSVDGVSLLQASFSWSLDVGGDAAPEITGTTQFLDAQGSPALPVTNVQDLLDALQGDLTALGSVLSGIPAGRQVRTSYSGSPASLPATNVQGEITMQVGEGGVPSASSGWQTTTTGEECSSDVSWTDLAIERVESQAWPTGSIDVEVLAPHGSLDGTLTLDGTDTAVLVASLDGGEAQTWTLDLTTGEVN